MLLSACDPYKHPFSDRQAKPEILIYVGETMAEAVTRLAEIFEKKENVVVKIIIGGSGFLKKSILLNPVGDIFFPGSEKYLSDFENQHFITTLQPVGYNKAALFVAKGNPKNINNFPQDLLRNDVAIAIGNPLSGSIGRETARITRALGVYNEIIDKAIFQAVDSKLLTNCLLNGETDAIINWQAIGYTQKTKNRLTAIMLPDEIALPHQLSMGILKCTHNYALAKKFTDLAASNQGQMVFKQFGFAD